MKGYETGILMRSKNEKIEDFGCYLPDDATNSSKHEETLKAVQNAFSMAKALHGGNVAKEVEFIL